MSEVRKWLAEIGIPGMERLSEEFERRGFTTSKSLEYLEDGDLEYIFESPKKLLLAEKRAISKELQKIKGVITQNPCNPNSRCKQLNFGQSPAWDQHVSSQVPALNNPASSKSSAKSPLDSRAEELAESVELLEVQVESAADHVSKLKEEENSLRVVTRGRICSLCHQEGHNKNRCNGEVCASHLYCGLKDKHPELKKNISEGQKILSNLRKNLETAKLELEQFKMQVTRARGNFFALMRPRLKQMDPIKYLNRSALDKDLLVLQKALGKNIPSEADDWKLPHVIESYKRQCTPLYTAGVFQGSTALPPTATITAAASNSTIVQSTTVANTVIQSTSGRGLHLSGLQNDHRFKPY